MIPNVSGGSGGTAGIPDLSGGTGGTAGIPDLSGGTGAAPSGGTGAVGTGGIAGTGGAGAETSGGVSGAAPMGGTGATGAGGSSTGVPLGTIVVSAGTLARDHTIVSFPFPAGAGKALVLKDSQGATIPLQNHPVNGNAIFILPTLAAGQTATYTVEESPALPAGVTAAVGPDRTGDQLFLKQGESKIFRWTLIEDNFRGAQPRDVRAGYIFPLYTPSGRNVADDYQTDHPHMHGVWSAWTLTTFRGHRVDFWNGYDNTGRVDLTQMKGIWSGPVHGGLIASLVHSDITATPAVPALNEEWFVTVYKTHDGTAPFYVFDIDSTQSTAGTDQLVLETYHYGGFGFRGSEQWTDPSRVTYLTSEGHNRTSGDGQRAKWVAQFGTVDNAVAGYAGFDHPTNFRHPQGLRIHPSNPYWSFTACTQSAGGRFTIAPGMPYRSRYRVVSFDGAANATLLNRLWSDFATPPTVTVMP